MFGFGKFDMLTQAMKAGALALSFKGTDKTMARAAIMAMIRTGSPRAHRIRLLDHDVRFGNEVTWVFGTEADGRSDALELILKENGRDGRRSVLISRDETRTDPRSWALGDWFGMQFDTFREHDEMVSILSDYLRDPGFSHLRIILPPASGGDPDAGIRTVLDAFQESGLKDAVIGFDPQGLSDHPSEIEKIRGFAAASGNRIILSEKDKSIVGPDMIRPEDAMVIMMPKDRNAGGFSLYPRHAVLHHDGRRKNVLFRYEDRSHAILSPDMRKLEKRIRERSPCRTVAYHERLELIARACGYRSWHAAQGRA